MTLGRREFLQRLSGMLAILGGSDMALAGSSEAYQRALARSSRRLALLVGIDQYPDTVWQPGASLPKGGLLQGALMDVELQKELLINHFGTSPKDILMLINQQATRAGILDAIQTHLVDAVEPGDTVVFHFSGLGGLVRLSGQSQAGELPTLVPVDGRYPTDANQQIHDLFEETLVEALQSLRGTRIITVLDTSCPTPQQSAFQGNFRVRSRIGIPDGRWESPEREAFATPSKGISQVSESWPGLLLRASRPGTPALEGNWDGFSAGAFTYALTQEIWSSVPSQRQYWVVYRAEHTLRTCVGTSAKLQVNSQSSARDKDNLLLAGSVPRPAAIGVVKTVDVANGNVNIWLGGLPASLLPYCSLGMRLQPLPTLPGLVAVPDGQLSIKVVNGLLARAEALGESVPSPGMPLAEVERRLPRALTLVVALDPELERIERVDATSAFSGLSFITTTAPGEQQVDCLFGHAGGMGPRLAGFTNASSKEETSLQPRYGVFFPDHTPIPGIPLEGEEAVKTAISRLGPFLRSLLAVKMLRLTVNPVSSQLPLRSTLEASDTDAEVLTFDETLRSRQFSRSAPFPLSETLLRQRQSLESSQPLRVRLLNLGQQKLYYLLISVVDGCHFSVYCPSLATPEAIEKIHVAVAEASQLLPTTESLLPPRDGKQLTFQQLQTVDFFALVCVKPFYETWKAIHVSDVRQLNNLLIEVSDPLSVTKAVLQDLNNAGMSPDGNQPATSDSIVSLQTSVWSTLSLRMDFA